MYCELGFDFVIRAWEPCFIVVTYHILVGCRILQAAHDSSGVHICEMKTIKGNCAFPNTFNLIQCLAHPGLG
jgi:hypothetical protein